MERKSEFGVLLPHFGSECSPSLLYRSVKKIEEYGFHSIWARDHVFIPAGQLEMASSTNFTEPVLTLAAMAGATRKLKLGFGVLIPFRHPVKLAQDLLTLDYLSGAGLIVGFGIGSNRSEFDAVGVPFHRRARIVEQTIQLFRRLWSEENVTYRGEDFSIEGLTLTPRPERQLKIWYGGKSAAAIERAIALCDGWVPGRVALSLFKKTIPYIKERVRHRERFSIGNIIPTAIADTGVEAEQKVRVSAESFEEFGLETFEEIKREYFLLGSPEEICEQVESYLALGTDHLIFDLRLQFDEFEHCLALLGQQVLPEFL